MTKTDNVFKPLTVKELIKNMSSRPMPSDDLSVVVRLTEPSVGYSACAYVIGSYKGIDWDKGKLFLNLDRNIMTYDKRMIERHPKNRDIVDNTIKIGDCPNCGHSLVETMNYCPECGQKICWRTYI